MKKLYKFLLLPLEQKKLTLQTMIWLILYRTFLWIVPGKKLNKIIKIEVSRNEISSNTENEAINWQIVKNVVRTVRKCSRYVPQASCLTQALVTRKLLYSFGQNSNLKIGVGRDEKNEFIAHAWVESGGKIIIGRTADIFRYSVMTNRR